MIYVSEIMTSQPYTLSANSPVSDAIKLMSENHIRHIPIVNDANELKGIVSDRDLLATTGNKIGTENSQTTNFTNMPVSEIMTTHVLSVTENTELLHAARFLEKHTFDALPVIKDKKLVGIVTDSDFLAVSINLLEQLAIVEPEEELTDQSPII